MLLLKSPGLRGPGLGGAWGRARVWPHRASRKGVMSTSWRSSSQASTASSRSWDATLCACCKLRNSPGRGGFKLQSYLRTTSKQPWSPITKPVLYCL